MAEDVSTHQLGTITARDMQRVFDQHRLGRLTAMRPAAGGSFHQVLEIESTSGRWIFKGAPLVREQFYAEYFYTTLLHERTALPVPWPYMHDTSCSVFAWDFGLMPRLPGSDLGDAEFWNRCTVAERHELAVDMGRRIAQVAAVAADEAGTYTFASHDVRPFPCGYAAGLVSETQELIRRARAIEPASIPPSDVAWIEHGIADLACSTPAVATPRLTMQDFKDQNMVAAQTDGAWHVSGIFDLGGLHFGDPAMGFCRQIAQFRAYDQGEALTRAFIQSAIRNGIDDANLAPRITGFVIHERLCIWEWAKREGRSGIVGDATTFREWAEPVVHVAVDSLR